MSPFTVKPDTDTGGMLPVGQHDVQITNAAAGTNDKGTPEIKLELQDHEGRWLSAWVYPTDKAMWKVKELWLAAGLPWPEQGGQIHEADLVGKTVHVEIYEDSYDGRTQVKVGGWSRPVGSDIPSDTGTAGGFAAAAGLDDDDKASY